MSVDLIIGVIFGLAGLILVAIAVFICIRTRVFMSTAQEVKGTVTHIVSSSDSEEGTVYAPVFKFTTIHGQGIEVTEKVFRNPPQFKAGQILDILYDPQDISHAHIKKWSTLYFEPLLLGGLGVVFGCVGIILLIFQVIDPFS